MISHGQIEIGNLNLPRIDLTSPEAELIKNASTLPEWQQYLTTRLAVEFGLADAMRKLEAPLPIISVGESKGQIHVCNTIEDAIRLKNDKDTGIVIYVDDLIAQQNPLLGEAEATHLYAGADSDKKREGKGYFHIYGLKNTIPSETDVIIEGRVSDIATQLSCPITISDTNTLFPLSFSNEIRFSYNFHPGHYNAVNHIRNPHPTIVYTGDLTDSFGGSDGVSHEQTVIGSIRRLFKLADNLTPALYSPDSSTTNAILDQISEATAEAAKHIHLPPSADPSLLFQVPKGSVFIFGKNEKYAWHRGTISAQLRKIYFCEPYDDA